MRIGQIGAVATLLALLSLATACSSSTNGSGAGSSPPNSASASSSPSSDPVSVPVSSSSSSPAITQAELDDALLTRDDVGYGFRQGSYAPNDQRNPCDPPGTPSVDQRVPPQLSSGRTLDSGTVDAELVQSASIYHTPAEAARAFALAVKGVSCRHGTLSDGTAVTIAAGVDVTSQVNDSGVGTSTAWQLSNAQVRGVIVATLSGRVANACIFVAAANVDTSELPDPVAIAKLAFDKLLAH